MGRSTRRRLGEVAASALALFAVGYALWPPGHVYWTALADFVGTVLTMAVVLSLAGLVGAAITAVSDVALSSLTLGGGLAYAVGVLLVEAATSPISPAHRYLYGGLLLSALLGAVAGERYRSDGVQ